MNACVKLKSLIVKTRRRYYLIVLSRVEGRREVRKRREKVLKEVVGHCLVEAIAVPTFLVQAYTFSIFPKILPQDFVEFPLFVYILLLVLVHIGSINLLLSCKYLLLCVLQLAFIYCSKLSAILIIGVYYYFSSQLFGSFFMF